MAGIQLSGLASGMDWKSTVSQLMQIERIPQDNLRKQQASAQKLQGAFDTLKTNLQALKTAATALSTGITGSPRVAQITAATDSVTGAGGTAVPTSTASVTTAAGATVGQYKVVVKSLPSVSSLKGASTIVPSETAAKALKLSDYGVTAGTFSLNGVQYTIAESDLNSTIDQVFSPRGPSDGARPAPNGSITLGGATSVASNLDISMDASGNLKLAAGDGGSSPNFSIGASGDTSNILSALGLKYDSAASAPDLVTSQEYLVYQQAMPVSVLAKLKLSDLSGGGALSGSQDLVINGVNVGSFDQNTTLGSVLSAINGNSAAGVTAALDPSSGSLRLVANLAGANGISTASTGGDLKTLLGLDAANFARGSGTRFDLIVNGTSVGTDLSTASGSVIDLSNYGYGSTKITPSSTGTFTTQVTASASEYKTKITALISAYNSLKQMVDESTRVTVGSDGKVSASVFSNRADINSLLSGIRSKFYNAVSGSGINSSYDTVGKIGLGFDSSGQMSITDSSKLESALLANPSAVAALFNAGATPSTIKVTNQAFPDRVTVSAADGATIKAGGSVTASWLPSGTKVAASSSGTITFSNSYQNPGDTFAYTPPVSEQGIATRLTSLMSTLLGTSGLIAAATSSITTQNTRLQNQIDSLERSLTQKQKSMEASFIAMEKAQSKFQNMASQITSAFASISSK